MSPYHKLCKAFLLAFGVLHIVAVIVGWEVAELGFLGTLICIFIVAGFGTMAAAYLDNSLLRILLGLGYCVGWVLEWGRMVTWLPPWEPIQYYLISFLNLAAATALFILVLDREEQ